MQRYCVLSFLIIITLVLSCGCFASQSKSPDNAVVTTPQPTVTTISLPTTLITTIVTTLIPTPTPEIFPNALKLKQFFNFSSGKSTSQATVYRFWINDSYQVFNPQVAHYVTKSPALGNKYLIIFVNIVDRGTTRLFPPKSSNIAVYYDGSIFFPDPTHDLPQSPKNIDSPPIILRIGEIEFFHNLDESEYVEDFGYSHGMEQAYLLPGESNAIDGYIIYEVPASLSPDKTFVKIIFNSQDSAVWRLA